MRCVVLLRWCVYLFNSVISIHLCEGIFYNPIQRDSRHNGSLPNSSPNLYSVWSQWATCSVTCGTGISSRTRTCLKSSYNSRGVPVPLCHGEFAEHKICNLQLCPVNSPDVREFQCSQYNNQVIAGKLVKTWTPSNGGPNPCELRCEARTEMLVYGFGKARDGTPCPLGVCLDGRCLRIGCDDRLGSGVTLDMCGVCGGKNSSCVHYKDVYEGQSSFGSGSRGTYHEVVIIPYAAQNLIIRQPLGKNILALQDRSKGIIFNDQSGNKYGGHFEVAGSIVEYRKLDVLAEELLAKGPLTQELKVLVLLRSRNPGIYYEYWLPKQNHNPVKSHYSLRPPNLPILPTVTTLRNSQSYSIPFYNSRSAPPTRPSYHHPTKPPFAYGYGDKPYKGQESPIFRHILSTSPPNYEGKYNPSSNKIKSESPVSSNTAKEHPTFKRGVYKSQPVEDYYALYRNASRALVPASVKQPAAAPNYSEELPDLTQGDSGFSNGGGTHQNVIAKDVLKEKKQEVPISKNSKTIGIEIPISKRIDKDVKNYVPNGRLKYSFESKDTDEVYVNSSGRYTPAPLTINVLPLPGSGKSKLHTDRRKKGRVQKPRLTRGGICEPCQRNRDQTKHFCESDFVVRALVIDFEFVHGETRYELEVKQSFKNTLPLLPKEYIWSPDTCRCPKLRPGKEYIIMGRSDNSYKKRESRLLVDKTSFVRTFNLKYVRRLQKLRKDQEKKCKKVS